LKRKEAFPRLSRGFEHEGKTRVYWRLCRVRVFDQPQKAKRDAGINLSKTNDPREGRQATMKERTRFYFMNAGDGTLGA